MHWTYASFEESDDLEQGDLLKPTDDLKKLLSDVHPHFRSDKYLGFIVATQSCDLVRRHGDLAKANYISIAAIRSLRQVMPRLLDLVIKPVGPGIYKESTKIEARRFLERLFNQNEQSVGLFYLHPDGDIELGEPAVVYLRVKVALKSEHYPILTGARIGRLSPEFRGKFGWLIGNLYSRTASRDWSDFSGGEENVRNLIKSYLDDSSEKSPVWLPDETVEAAIQAKIQSDNMDRSALLSEFKKHEPLPKLTRLIAAIVQDTKKVVSLTEEAETKLTNRLANNGPIKKILK